MNKYEAVQSYLAHNPKVWLVTGVAGFIGSNLLEQLLKLNQYVVGIDNLSTGYERNIDQALLGASRVKNKDVSDNFKYLESDVRNLMDCEEACQGVDFVLHQAALGSVPRSVASPKHTHDSNVNGFLNMLVASKDAGVKRFVYASSSSVYGDHEALPKNEPVIGSSLSPYAVTKRVNELYAAVFAKTYGFRTIGLRYFNVFGKRQDPNGPYAAVIPKWISAMIGGDEIYINGDGESSRDFCYVENTVQMNLLAATTTEMRATDQIYNVALNDRMTLNVLRSLLEDLVREVLGDIRIKPPVHREFREGDVRHSQANIDKAKNLLGYEPKYTAAEGLKEAVSWYIENLGT